MDIESTYFCGIVSQRSYGVCHAIEFGHAYIGTTTETVFRFEGMPYSLAFGTGIKTVVDVNGNEYAVSFAEALSMSHTNPPHVEMSNTVTRTRLSPHMWDVEITFSNTTSGL